MIKRDGNKIDSAVSAKNKNASFAEKHLEILRFGKYTSINGQGVSFLDLLNKAISQTQCFPNPLDNVRQTPKTVPVVEVTNEKTDQAAQRLLANGKENIVILNFASAKSPGGGFVAGAKAQEEDLCRVSGLYYCLKNNPQFYNQNILFDNPIYTDNIIYSPDVPFIRDSNLLLIDTPFTLSVITAPAPNVSAMEAPSFKEVEGVVNRRCKKILQVAALYEHKNIVLGAWGCGVFGNDPEMVANGFLLALREVPVFEHVTFAVYDTRPEEPLFNSFNDLFSTNKV